MQLFLQMLKLLACVSDCWPFKNYVAFSHLGQDHVTVFKMLTDTSTPLILILCYYCTLVETHLHSQCSVHSGWQVLLTYGRGTGQL